MALAPGQVITFKGGRSPKGIPRESALEDLGGENLSRETGCAEAPQARVSDPLQDARLPSATGAPKSREPRSLGPSPPKPRRAASSARAPRLEGRDSRSGRRKGRRVQRAEAKRGAINNADGAVVAPSWSTGTRTRTRPQHARGIKVEDTAHVSAKMLLTKILQGLSFWGVPFCEDAPL